MTFYVVYLCGCTDCFPWAAFVCRSHAEDWAKENNSNPEGYLIKEVTEDLLGKEMAKQD